MTPKEFFKCTEYGELRLIRYHAMRMDGSVTDEELTGIVTQSSLEQTYFFMLRPGEGMGTAKLFTYQSVYEVY